MSAAISFSLDTLYHQLAKAYSWQLTLLSIKDSRFSLMCRISSPEPNPIPTQQLSNRLQGKGAAVLRRLKSCISQSATAASSFGSLWTGPGSKAIIKISFPRTSITPICISHFSRWHFSPLYPRLPHYLTIRRPQTMFNVEDIQVIEQEKLME